MRDLPAQLAAVLRGAGRAGAAVISDEVRRNSRSAVVAENLVTRTRPTNDQVRATITVKAGWPRSVAIWQEYGTVRHFITVDEKQSGGRTAARVNRLARQGVLVINGQPVGRTVEHPGAQAHPVFRPALDMKRAEAVAAARAYVASRIVGRVVVAAPGVEDDG